MAIANVPIHQLQRAASNEVLDLVVRVGEPLVIVNSPPGAGKTTLVEAMIAVAWDFGLKVAVATPRAEQSYDLVRRLLLDYRATPIALDLAKERDLPDDLARHPARIGLDNTWNPLNHGSRVLIGT